MVKQITIYPPLDYQDPDEILECQAKVILSFDDDRIEYEHTGISTQKKVYNVNFELPAKPTGVILVTRYREEEPYSLDFVKYPTVDKDNIEVHVNRSTWSCDDWLVYIT